MYAYSGGCVRADMRALPWVICLDDIIYTPQNNYSIMYVYYYNINNSRGILFALSYLGWLYYTLNWLKRCGKWEKEAGDNFSSVEKKAVGSFLCRLSGDDSLFLLLKLLENLKGNYILRVTSGHDTISTGKEIEAVICYYCVSLSHRAIKARLVIRSCDCFWFLPFFYRMRQRLSWHSSSFVVFNSCY